MFDFKVGWIRLLLHYKVCYLRFPADDYTKLACLVFQSFNSGYQISIDVYRYLARLSHQWIGVCSRFWKYLK